MSDGVELGLKLERLAPAQALLAAATRWSQRASHLLEAAAEAAQSSPDEVLVRFPTLPSSRMASGTLFAHWRR